MAKMSIRELRRIIKEEIAVLIDLELDEIEPSEEWSGGDNLVLPIDHAAAVDSDPVTASPETLSITDDTGIYRMSESALRRLIRNITEE